MEVSSQINNELKSLEEIFGQGKRVFRIPDYQRGYSWEKQQRIDLLKDIKDLINSKDRYRHYTGTIVASFNQEETDKRGRQYQVYDIVDGQQRVTSLILLLSVICRSVVKSTEKSKCEYTEVFLKFIQGGTEGNSVHKLNLGEEGQDKIFKSLVEKGITTATESSTHSKSDQNLKDAVDEYEEWLKQQDIDKEKVLRCVCKDLGFLFYAPEKDKEIGIMFEVINNRGKALSELEKIKNYLIYYADKNGLSDIRCKVKGSWPEILRVLNKINYTSNESEDRFLRNCWIVFMDTNKSRSYYVYDNLKRKWPSDSKNTKITKKIKEFIQFLEDAAKYYALYLNREDVTDTQEKAWLERISCHPADASITPLILAIFSKVEDQNDRNMLFELLEKLNFRFYGTGIAGRSDTGQGDLFWYANTFFNYFGEEENGIIYDVQWLKEELTNFVGERANDKSFIESLTLDKDEAGDYHSWVGLKFFLASYEEQLNKGNNKSSNLLRIMAPQNPDARNDFYQKEHIWAVQDYARIQDKKNLNVNKRRLGNFLLLEESLNKKVKNKPPEEKVESLYFEDPKKASDTQMIRELKEFFDDAQTRESYDRTYKTNTYWLNVYQRFLDRREEEMINFALERWRVSGLSSNISKVTLNSLSSQNQIWARDEN